MNNTTPTSVRFRRSGRVRLVRVAERAETWTTDSGSPMSVEPGDMIVTSGERTWSITPESFAATYAQVEGDVYERTGEVWARPANPGELVATQEGEDVAGESQWRVTDDDGNSWFVPEDVFTANYRPALTTDQVAMQVLQDFVARQYLRQFPLSETQRALADAIVGLLGNEGRVSVADLTKVLFPYDELDAVNTRLRRLRKEIAKLAKEANVPFALKVTAAKKVGPQARFLWFEGVSSWSPRVSTPELDAIPASGEYVSKATEPGSMPAQGTPVVDAMLDWVANPAEPQLFALLGEYGMGKTVSCQRFTRQLAERRKANPTLPMPLYFNLKNVADARLADNLEDLVVTCMRDDWLPKHSPQHTWQAFTSWLATGPCVVIFDGLDEMLVKLDTTQGSLFLNRLLGTLQLLNDEDANRRIRLVLSCRTQYFRTLLEQRSFFLGKDRQDLRADSYRAMTLLPLGDDQIRRYLETALPGSDIARIMELVSSVHNLPEMAARPYTLRLIAEHIPEIERTRASGKPVFGARLYAKMVERWLARDSGRHFIDPDHKSAFMAELAAWLWREKKTAAPAKDVETIFRRWIRGDEDLNDIYPSTLTKSDKDKLNEDLRTATFLARQDDERGSTFGFAHTSLQEYFLARYLLDAIQRDDRSRWAMRTPSTETLDFLGQLLAEAQDPELIDTLSSWKENPYLKQTSELLVSYCRWSRKRNYPVPETTLRPINLECYTFRGQ